MKTNRLSPYKKITRTMYFLGILFLLSGLLLQILNVPAQAGAIDPAAFAPTRLPPAGGNPGPIKPPPGGGPSNPPSSGPKQGPGAGPVAPPNGPGSLSGINRGLSVLPTVGARPIRPQANSVYLRFSQSDYCLSAPAGPVSATVTVVALPPGMSSVTVSTDWYVVNPATGAGGAIEHHYVNHPGLGVGDSVSWDADWPGIEAWPTANGNPVEIHWGAEILNTSGAAAGLDAYYGGSCNARPTLSISHTCNVETNDITWTITNPGPANVPVIYVVDGATPGSEVTVDAHGSSTFTTPAGVHNVTISWDDGTGTKTTASDASDAACAAAPKDLVLKHSCVATGVQWTLENPNPWPVEYSWELDGTTQSGTLPANSGPTNLATGVSTIEHKMAVTFAGKTIRDDTPANACGLKDLSISQTCAADHTVQWAVSNPNGEPVSFTWSLDGGAGTTASIPANGSYPIPTSGIPGADHDLALTYAFGAGSASSHYTAGTCSAPPEAHLTVLHACVTDTSIQWKVKNDSASAVDFQWRLDNGSYASASVPANGTVDITTSDSASDHSVDITWGTSGKASGSSKAQECSEITVSHSCTLSTQTIAWTVTNHTANTVSVNWKLDGTGASLDVLANATVTVTTSSGGKHDFEVTWGDGRSKTDSSGAEECQAATKDLVLSYACVTSTGVNWSVTNPNTFPVTFVWDRDGKISGYVTVDGKKTVKFLTTPHVTKTTVNISWGEGKGASKTVSDSFCPGTFTPPTPSLSVSFACVVNSSDMQWTVSNGGGASVFFNWSMDGKQSGGETINAHSSKPFLVTTAGQHSISYSYTFEGKKYSDGITSDAKACIVVQAGTATPTPTPTVTPTKASVQPAAAQGTALPTVKAPGSATSGQGAILATGGADLTTPFGMPFWRALLTCLGLLFLGTALVFDGVIKHHASVRA